MKMGFLLLSIVVIMVLMDLGIFPTAAPLIILCTVIGGILGIYALFDFCKRMGIFTQIRTGLKECHLEFKELNEQYFGKSKRPK